MIRVVPVMAAALLAAAAAFAQEDEIDLPDGKGREETAALCGACHSMRLVTQQGMTRGRWDETLDWMVERHGMPQLEGDDRALILDYLAASFPPRQRGRPNPFLKN